MSASHSYSSVDVGPIAAAHDERPASATSVGVRGPAENGGSGPTPPETGSASSVEPQSAAEQFADAFGVLASSESCRWMGSPERWPKWPYGYGRIICMKKTLNVDDQLLKEAKLASGAATDTEAIRLGLEALVRRAAYERLRALLGSEPDAKDVPRRREKVSRRRTA